MNISPVSFASTAASSSFQEKISRPQSFTRPAENPSAASGLGKESKGKKHPVRKAAGVIIALGAAAAGLAYAAKTGKLAAGENETINRIKKPLEKAGSYIYDKAKTVISKIPQKAPVE